MQARAAAAAATNESILDAAEETISDQPGDEPTLKAIADRAGVSVQTILRHFGNRQALVVAALVRLGTRMRDDRERAPVGNAAGAVDVLVDHYEKYGDRILLLLANEDRHSVLHTLADFGRAYHGEWCKQVFAPSLEGLDEETSRRRVSQLATVTDIYVWKLLRRDHGLGLPEVKLAMEELVAPLTGDDS